MSFASRTFVTYNSVLKLLPTPHHKAVGTALWLCCAGCSANLADSVRASDAPAAIDTPVVATNDPVEPTGLHRLNANEYDATVHDLLGSKLQFSKVFLGDEFANGFDNNAAALTMTIARLQDYQLAAESLSAELVADGNGKFLTLAPCPAGTPQPACLKAFVTSFGPRAWRRPMTEAEVAAVLTTASSVETSYSAQVGLASTAILVSPSFLYRVEIGEGRTDGLLNGYELASRLSYFLWSSMPDDELTAAAADGSLLRDEVLEAQVARMSLDPRAKTFSNRFSGMWLGVRQAEAYLPDKATFPQFDDELKAAAVAQTQLTFADLLGGKMAFHELFDGNTTYLNDRLAKFYNMPLPGSQTLVQVPAGSRRGVLTQAAVLMGQSLPTRTSLVHRGAFLLNNLLCSGPPEAPPNVPTLATPTAAAKTQRQRLEAHATEPSCAVCHNMLDPYGFVLEAYDATGAYRSTENGVTIDTSAKLPDGTAVANVDELSAVFAKSPAVSLCMAQKLATYAIGRTLSAADTAEVTDLHAAFLSDDQRVDHLIHNLVLSPMFRRHG